MTSLSNSNTPNVGNRNNVSTLGDRDAVISPGARVQIVGLSSHPEYNNKFGVVKAHHVDRGIYAIMFEFNNSKKGLSR